jgi:hypothetical protein
MLTEEQFAADVKLLNESAVHIVTTRDENGRRRELSRETIHALADVLRCLKAEKTTDAPCATCGCTLRTKLVGDGCPVCNPNYWKQFSEE